MIYDVKRGVQIPLNGAVWADWDKRGRLVYAKGGKLFAGELDEFGQVQSNEIADFNSNTPEPMETPDWAKAW